MKKNMKEMKELLLLPMWIEYKNKWKKAIIKD